MLNSLITGANEIMMHRSNMTMLSVSDDSSCSSAEIPSFGTGEGDVRSNFALFTTAFATWSDSYLRCVQTAFLALSLDWAQTDKQHFWRLLRLAPKKGRCKLLSWRWKKAIACRTLTTHLHFYDDRVLISLLSSTATMCGSMRKGSCCCRSVGCRSFGQLLKFPSPLRHYRPVFWGQREAQ